jgi:hypothetical protein
VSESQTSSLAELSLQIMKLHVRVGMSIYKEHQNWNADAMVPLPSKGMGVTGVVHATA